MSFQGKYQIQSALGEGEAPSFRALQVSSGQSVLVHHLVAGKSPPQQPDLAFLIFRFLSRASDEESRKLLDMGEDEGRIYVVTPDVPECRDLRQWLQSVTGTPEAEAPPATPASGPVNLDSTRAFTTDALRQALRYAESAAVPNPPVTEGTSSPDKSLGATRAYTTEAMRQALRHAEGAPAPVPPQTAAPPAGQEGGTGRSTSAPPPAAPAAEEGPDVLKPFPQILATSVEIAAGRVTDFTAFWEKASSASPVAVAGPAEAKGGAGQIAGLDLTPPAVTPPVAAPEGGEVRKPETPPAATPAAKAAATIILSGIKDLLLESDQASPSARAPVPQPGAAEKSGANVKVVESAPRSQIPAGFQVVFQSNKPRSRSSAPSKSGIMAAPAPVAPPTAPIEPAPPPVAAVLPNAELPVISTPASNPPAGKAEETLVLNLPHIQGEPMSSAGAMNGLTSPPPPALVPPLPEPAARVVPAPSVPPSPPPTGQSSKAPESATRFVAAPPPLPDSTLRPTPLNRSQPGEFTRMMLNVKALAGPLPPAASRPVASPAASSPAIQPTPYPDASAPFPASPCIVKDTPLLPIRKKRPVWVPILILSSLFLMTVALLVFFAFKH